MNQSPPEVVIIYIITAIIVIFLIGYVIKKYMELKELKELKETHEKENNIMNEKEEEIEEEPQYCTIEVYINGTTKTFENVDWDDVDSYGDAELEFKHKDKDYKFYNCPFVIISDAEKDDE